ncbi:MAG: multicopper oxidase domain-containing protein [Furfurilactobacillus sp.]|jgi:FtsP/CotA-like multicopper oxidase with cupredoxin domain|uniref:Multicopper oxidase domain-containing protein n=1 Tax=Furfurilactobacillus milii TaxID=2888272 RepID=A0ABT6DBU1_9LACO|nr:MULTISPECIES: multicopper oxidase domain-containing protein [Furfurilactobacillus]QLE67079.1 Blue copper oxidase CueO precursor [Furfurilactobacillus rossiae]MCF6161339.1 multicopper oxidase domain-containing protein [Furfurilactobacillus milii]MCF6163719.1 multicopper oxidase domain-containing protein [Furfurilactobacillus milii]MCF6418910.1 multicopper oxidase domain-containing protein [Furfurilactobacillus milii]MCH4011277.1 multicopper oxidase domain-containing protein [Furfurilactobaci
MSEQKVYNDYFYDEPVYDLHDGGYVPLKVPDVPEKPLTIPSVLKPDKVDGNDVWYTIRAQAGETQILPGAKTKTWGYNASLLGQTVVLKDGVHYHVHIVNELPEVTTLHWHGLNVPGPVTDGGPHAPIYPGESRDIDFTLNQPAQTDWIHPHPCPNTARQVWNGLAAAVVVTDDVESKLPFPRNYGVDDIPVILQDRSYHDNQLDYDADYDVDGTLGDTPLVNGTVNGVFKVTTQRIRLRILNGADRREYRLHFSDDHEFTQVGSDGGILPAPVKLTKLMLTCAERAEVIVDFGDHKPGDRVQLMSDDVPLMTFEIDDFEPDNTQLPDHLVDLADWEPTPGLPVEKTVMSGMDDEVRLDGKLFDMQRIDRKQKLGDVVDWDVTNTNDMGSGMIHPFHMHGCHFLVLSRNGKAPYPNEHGYKDVVGVNAGETVRIRVMFDVPGVFMYHCHILEHEDTGMMAQIEAYDPDHSQTFHLLSMDDVNNRTNQN